jgi:hypothetical protein
MIVTTKKSHTGEEYAMYLRRAASHREELCAWSIYLSRCDASPTSAASEKTRYPTGSFVKSY